MLYGVDGDRALRPIPKAEHSHQTGEQHRGAAGIANAKGAVGEVGHGGAERRGSDNRGPIEYGIEFSRENLRNDEGNQQGEEKRGAGEIAPEIKQSS